MVMASPIDRLVREYAEYLSRERGLVASTIRGYTDFVKRFAESRSDGARLRWERLGPADINAFVLRQARRWSVGHSKLEVTKLRSLLRYLHVSGRIRSDPSSCVPAVAGWRLAWLPKALEPDQLRRVLRSCDPRSVIGRRAAAIVRLLVRLGLRAGDVAALTLDDVDWRAGEIVLREKGRRESRLPMPRDVGRVLVAYLRRGRPRTSSRRDNVTSRLGRLGPRRMMSANTKASRRSDDVRVLGRAIVAVVQPVDVVDGRREEIVARVVERRHRDGVEHAPERLHVALCKYPDAAVLAECVGQVRAGLPLRGPSVVRERIDTGQRAERRRALREREPRSSLGAQRTVAPSGPGREVEVGLVANSSAVTATGIRL